MLFFFHNTCEIYLFKKINSKKKIKWQIIYPELAHLFTKNANVNTVHFLLLNHWYHFYINRWATSGNPACLLINGLKFHINCLLMYS